MMMMMRLTGVIQLMRLQVDQRETNFDVQIL
jgi:hypothetical protein